MDFSSACWMVISFECIWAAQNWMSSLSSPTPHPAPPCQAEEFISGIFSQLGIILHGLGKKIHPVRKDDSGCERQSSVRWLLDRGHLKAQRAIMLMSSPGSTTHMQPSAVPLIEFPCLTTTLTKWLSFFKRLICCETIAMINLCWS